MKEQATKRKETVIIPAEIVVNLKRVAEQNQRSFNRELVWALQQYLEQQAQRKK